jgi:HSF-type DNA-binding
MVHTRIRCHPPSKISRSVSYTKDESDEKQYHLGSSNGDCTPHSDMIDTGTIARGGVACPFPWKLHEMLDYCCPEHITNQSEPLIVTWNEDGTAFAVLDTKAFVQTILPRYVVRYSEKEAFETGLYALHLSYLTITSRILKRFTQILCAEQIR